MAAYARYDSVTDDGHNLLAKSGPITFTFEVKP